MPGFELNFWHYATFVAILLALVVVIGALARESHQRMQLVGQRLQKTPS